MDLELYKHVQYNENKMKKSKPYCKCHATLFIMLKGRLWNERTKDRNKPFHEKFYLSYTCFITNLKFGVNPGFV